LRDDGTHFSETYRISFRQSSRTPAGIGFAKNARFWLAVVLRTRLEGLGCPNLGHSIRSNFDSEPTAASRIVKFACERPILGRISARQLSPAAASRLLGRLQTGRFGTGSWLKRPLRVHPFRTEAAGPRYPAAPSKSPDSRSDLSLIGPTVPDRLRPSP